MNEQDYGQFAMAGENTDFYTGLPPEAAAQPAPAAPEETFEQHVARLAAIVTALEKGDVPLADSLKLFEEGTRRVNACTKLLAEAEQQVMRLSQGPGGAPEEAPFEEGQA